MKDTTTNKNYLYFVAEDVGNAYNLWRSDGTPEGTTTLVKDTNTIGSSWLEYLTVMKDIYSNRNYLYFIENNDAGYNNIWRTGYGTPIPTPITVISPPSFGMFNNMTYYKSDSLGAGHGTMVNSRAKRRRT